MTARKHKPAHGTQADARARGLREVVALRLSRAAIEAIDAAARERGLSRGEWVEDAAAGPGGGLPTVAAAALQVLAAGYGETARETLGRLVKEAIGIQMGRAPNSETPAPA